MRSDLDKRMRLERKSKILGVRLEPREYALLRQQARKIGRTPSEIVRRLVRDYIKRSVEGSNVEH